MAILSKQIGWSQESNLIYEIVKQLNKLNGVIANSGASSYKVYTALLTQSGGSNNIDINFDDDPRPPIVIGTTYEIIDNSGGLDMINIGAPNNNNGTSFVATGITPISWGNGVIRYNTGAPVVTVLENTIGNIWFTYYALGNYNINSNNLFTSKLATFISGLEGAVGGGGGSPLGGGTGIYKTNDSLLFFEVYDNGTNPSDGAIVGYPIEIRVYS